MITDVKRQADVENKKGNEDGKPSAAFHFDEVSFDLLLIFLGVS